jgi:outer membrane autotransporter protein
LLIDVNVSSADGAFTLDKRYTVGAYEYQLTPKDNDWYLTSDYRAEAALYSTAPAVARTLGLATLGNLHQRVGDEENIRKTPETRASFNGVWTRAFGQHQKTSFESGPSSAIEGNLWGFQIGTDIYRSTTEGGHRNHLGVYGAYSGFNSTSVKGNVLGQTNVTVGKLTLDGPSAGVYWTHFGPTGWYLDAVAQGSWYNATATSGEGSKIDTNANGISASLEMGYPIMLTQCPNNEWVLEPQAQIIYQNFSVNGTRDNSSALTWNTADAITGRLGLRLYHTSTTAGNTIWQPYIRVNLWEAFKDSDKLTFDNSAPVDTRFGGMSLEGALGMTVKVNNITSIYGEAGYRHDIGNSQQKLEAISGTVGMRFNW